MLESKLKRAALSAAVDVALKNLKKSPERCARNLVELGTSAFPNRINNQEKDVLYHGLLNLCKNVDADGAKELFSKYFK